MKRRKNLPKGIRKYIRREKARIRQQILDLEEQGKQIKAVYEKLAKKNIK